jgi:hypothetical protein
VDRTNHELLLSSIPNFAKRNQQKHGRPQPQLRVSGLKFKPTNSQIQSKHATQTKHPITNLQEWHHTESALYVPLVLLLRQIRKPGPPILLSLGIHGLYLHQVTSPKKKQPKWPQSQPSKKFSHIISQNT